MKSSLIFSLPPSGLRVGLVEARNVNIKPSSDDYRLRILQETQRLLEPDFMYPDDKQKGIRSLLKTFGFHPSGRSRPASEFLHKDLQNRGSFNFINNAVDINNHLSLLSHLPISVIDLDKSGFELCLRVGFDDESYVFNREGHELSLKKLLVVARHGGDRAAVGSPVKDSQQTKVFAETKNLALIVYTSVNITSEEELNTLLNLAARLLHTEADAAETASMVLDACP
ncbi:MAG TPA: phenylalanine--tRNA ligase beta subunit-related protein [Candidatus Rifleibacterium sp.]|nr:phenylalanine--tRNA ligase beta subunit-related protein [Candidatus Rifleibacterium sp.]HPT46980.1 phenylalanine--tRNA ligase beta subunit-related protein [Candidatus Rifleibacterium sp.]